MKQCLFFLILFGFIASAEAASVTTNPDANITVTTVIGNVAHDAVDSGNPVKVGGKARDPSSLPAAVAAGDRSDIMTDLYGRIVTYPGVLQAGEDLTNNVMAAVLSPLAVGTYALSVDFSSTIEASSITKASAGTIYKFTGKIDSTAATDVYYIQLINSATVPADGSVTMLMHPIEVNHTTGTSSFFDVDFTPMGVFGSSGLVIVASTTEYTKTIAGLVMSMTALYK